MFAFGYNSTVVAEQGKTVHVKEYQKKDGTTVKAHDRRPPKESGESRGEKTRSDARHKEAAAVSSAASSSSNVKRDANGHIARSESAKHHFEIQTGYPNGRPGYVVDHIKPLACGGADEPSNMQWQIVTEAEAKDKWERSGCR